MLAAQVIMPVCALARKIQIPFLHASIAAYLEENAQYMMYGDR